MSQAPVELRGPERAYSAYVFDLDGTLYLGDAALPGAVACLTELRRRGAAVRFVSNNPTLDPAMHVAKLTSLGLAAEAHEVVNTVLTTTRWLTEHHPGAVVFAIAEEPLQQALRAAGFELSEDPARIDIVVASYDRGFDYRKLQIAFDALWFHRRAILVQTNPDRFCPYPGGRGEPDCAAITAAIEASTGVACEASFGKPDPSLLRAAVAGLGVTMADTLLVGDRLATDIAMAVAAGADSALVLSGEATLADVAAAPSASRPTFIVEGVVGILPRRSAHFS